MTISSEINRKEYTGNGATTSFSFPYYVIAAADLKVYKAGVLQTITTHYTLSGTAPYTSGTDVQFVSAPTSGQSIVIVRDPPQTQAVDLVENDPLPAETLETAYDKLTMLVQRLGDRMDRAIRLADTDVSGASVELPTPVASQLIGWNPDGDELENVDPDDIATIVGSQSWVVDKFSGDGATVAFALSENPGSVNALIVDISGVKQTHTADYTLSGTTLTFTAAPATGTNNIRVQYGQVQTSTTTPADGTVTTSKIVDANVTTDKIADDAVTFAKMQNISTDRLLGRETASSGNVEEIALGNGLVLDATTLYLAHLPVSGRLSLTTATPVTSSDVTGATTVYFVPYKGDKIPLYDGTVWKWYTFTELSQATTDSTKSPAAVANSSLYDVFAWNDSGTLRATRGPAWSSGTSRGTGAGTTELEIFEGRYVNKVAITNGPAARRGLYVGTIRSNGSAQIEDSQAIRYVWNNYNRVPRPMLRKETENTWDYTTATFRQANNTNANQLNFILGLSEDEVVADVITAARNPSGNVLWTVAIGLDSTTTVHANSINQPGESAAASVFVPTSASWRGLPGIGEHYLAWLEFSAATGTTTWIGDGGTTYLQSGMNGMVMA